MPDQFSSLCGLVGQHLLELGEAGKGVVSGGVGLALDQGEHVVDKGLFHAVAHCIDPFTGDLFLCIGYDLQRFQAGLARIAAFAGAPERHHLIGDAGYGGLHGCLARKESLVDVGLGGSVGAAALEQGEFDAADLGPGLQLYRVSQHGGQAAQLRMSKTVGSRGLGLGNKRAVGTMDALGHSHHALAGLVIHPVHIVQEVGQIKIGLGQIDQIGAIPRPGGQGGGTGQPAGVPAHDLDDGHHAGIIHVGVPVDLHTGGSDKLGGGTKAGAVVGAVEIVVNGLCGRAGADA